MTNAQAIVSANELKKYIRSIEYTNPVIEQIQIDVVAAFKSLKSCPTADWVIYFLTSV